MIGVTVKVSRTSAPFAAQDHSTPYLQSIP